MLTDRSPIEDMELEGEEMWVAAPESPPNGLVSMKRKRSLEVLETSIPMIAGSPTPSTVPLTEFVKAEAHHLLTASSFQPMMSAMNEQCKQLQVRQQAAISSASALIADLKHTMAECQQAQEVSYRQQLMRQNQMAALKAEQVKREDNVRVFASNAERKFAHSDQLLKQQVHHLEGFSSNVESKFSQSDHAIQMQRLQLAEQSQNDKRPAPCFGEDDRGRRRLIKEEENLTHVYSPPVRRKEFRWIPMSRRPDQEMLHQDPLG